MMLATIPAVILAVLLAMIIDRLFGEPPARWHPVVWMGHYLGIMGRRIAPSEGEMRPRRDLTAFLLGAGAWLLGAVVVAGIAFALQLWLLHQPWWLCGAGMALLLKPLLAWRMLRDEVLAVDEALQRSLAEGREQLARLVSRDVTELSAAEVNESAIESLAENLNDSVVAPLMWFVIAGLPGAALYRFANTADAMWGYPGLRGGRQWAWAGKWAARADDVLSWLPARLCALGIMVQAWMFDFSALRREAVRTPSPNSGWPMGAAALVLGIRLGKPNAYVLNPEAQSPVAGDVRRAVRLGDRTLVLSVLAFVVLAILLQTLLGGAHGPA